MKNNSFSPLEIYTNKAFRLIIIGIPLIAVSAGFTISMVKLLGLYPTVSTKALLLFDASCLIYFFIGLYFYRHCENPDGVLYPGILKKGKIFLLILCLIQWNFLSYMVPSRDMWAYALFFVVLASVFLDSALVAIVAGEILVSVIVSWIIIPDRLLPVRDEFFIPELSLRVVLLLLGLSSVWMITNMIEKRLAAEFEKIADYDTLTLLFNRRKLEMHLDNAAEQYKTKGKEFSIIMTDIDNFKTVNDTYGHNCGDEVLKDIANIIRMVVDNKGLSFRYGGEEMMILLYADTDAAVAVAEQIREKVEAHVTHYEDVSITVTITLGVATYQESDSNEILIKRADTNLYYGKNHGKNCVIK